MTRAQNCRLQKMVNAALTRRTYQIPKALGLGQQLQVPPAPFTALCGWLGGGDSYTVLSHFCAKCDFFFNQTDFNIKMSAMGTA